MSREKGMTAPLREKVLGSPRVGLALVALLALFFVARGPESMSLRDVDSIRRLPVVSAAPPGDALDGYDAFGALDGWDAASAFGDFDAFDTVRRDGVPSVGALAALLFSVNPSLGDRNANRIAAAVVRSSAKYRLDPVLVTAVLLVESGARPWARSPKGAIGLMQVMPYMMEPMRLAGNPATIESNVEAGCWILANNIRRLGEANGISTYFWGSDVRGGGYLQKVRAAEAEVRRYWGSEIPDGT